MAPSPVSAQEVVTSAGPERVAVTLYRDPHRAAWYAPNPNWLRGYALVTETRTVTLPAGESEVRFEGVAGGIVPQSAIVTGFPDGVVERNRDAYLLSPSSLLDRSLGQRVMIRRTVRATGAVTRTEAIIRSGADGAVVLQTAEGVEALRCTGLPETITYGTLPGGLSARPTLSVRTRAGRPVTTTVSLSYLASGFDWRASYIVTLSPDGTRIDLLAWLTLSSNDETSFVNADLQAVAGRINRAETEDEDMQDEDSEEEQARERGSLHLQCWPAGTTSDIPLEELQRMAMGRGRNLLEPLSDVVVTGTRLRMPNLESTSPIVAMTAEQEELGDVKLYRVPEPVTLAARSQKQIAFLERQHIRVRYIYRQIYRLYNASADGLIAPELVMVARNRAGEGLNAPLPGGAVLVFTPGTDRSFFLGEGGLRDHALGEDLEIGFGGRPGVLSRFRMLSRDHAMARFMLVVSNDGTRSVPFEAELDFRVARSNARLGQRNGHPLWAVTVPANGRKVLCFSIVPTEDDDLPDEASGPDAACPADASDTIAS